MGFTPFNPSYGLRKAKERTIPALYDRIGRALNTFELTEFPNYFRNSGYAPT